MTVDPLFSASKARWLLKAAESKGITKDKVCIGNVDSWLLWKLTGGVVHATDVSNAARTQLLNLQTVQWDDELLELFEIPSVCLPTIHHSSEILGETHRSCQLAVSLAIRMRRCSGSADSCPDRSKPPTVPVHP